MIVLTNNKKFGTFIFYLCWPLVWFYAPLRVRVRIVIELNKKIIVVKNWFGPNTWQLPGGGMKLGENTMQTAIREAAEELGIDISKTNNSLVNLEPKVIKQFGLLFRYQYVHVKLTNKPDIKIAKELSEIDWILLSDAKLPNSIRASIRTV